MYISIVRKFPITPIYLEETSHFLNSGIELYHRVEYQVVRKALLQILKISKEQSVFSVPLRMAPKPAVQKKNGRRESFHCGLLLMHNFEAHWEIYSNLRSVP